MKILIVRTVATELDRTKYNIQEEGIAKEYISLGHSCDIVFYTKGKYFSEKIHFNNGCYTVHYVPAFKIYDSAVFYRKYLYPLIENADVIVCEEYEQLQSCILALKYPDKTVIYHGPYKSNYKKKYQLKSKMFDFFFLKKIKKRKIKFITKSNLAKRTLEEKGIKNIEIVPVGLDFNKFKNVDLDKFLLKSNDLKRINILYVGVIEDRRNITFLIEIINKIKKLNIPVCCTIVGEGNSEYKQKCLELVSLYGLEKEILFYGKVAQRDLPQMYFQNEFFILPTKYEIYGMVILEALLFGRIVLTTYNGGSDMLIENGVNGYILSLDNIDDWLKTILNVYYKDVEKTKISSNAQNTAKVKGNWLNSAKLFIKYINKDDNR